MKAPEIRPRIVPSRLLVLGVGTTMIVLCLVGVWALAPGAWARQQLADRLTAHLAAVMPIWDAAAPPTDKEVDRGLRKIVASVSVAPDLEDIEFIALETGERFRFGAGGERQVSPPDRPAVWMHLQQGRRTIIVDTDRYDIYQPLTIPGHAVGVHLTVGRDAFSRTEDRRSVSLIAGGMILSALIGTLLMLRVARSLEESRGELELVLESTQEPLIMVDSSQRLVFANSPARLLLGKAREDKLVGQPLLALCPSPEAAAFFRAVLETDQPAVDELYTAFPGYSQDAVFRGHAVPVRTEIGRPLGRLLVLRNITLEKRLEDRKVSQTIHELKGMLGEATGFIRQVASQLPQDGASDNQMFLNLSLEKLHHCYVTVATMVRNIASAFMPEELDLHRRHLAIGELMRQNVQTFEAMMPVDQVHPTVTLTAPEDLPMTYCDRAAISRIVMNLLGNASQHCPRGRLDVSVADSGRYLMVQVKDDGAGIAPEHLPRIFEPHQSFRSGGTGMGLSVCRDFVRAHGGHIWAESAGRGRGATFTFSLPKSRPAIIANDPGLIQHLRQRCADVGYDAYVIDDLLSAVKQVGDAHPNFVLLDLDLRDTLNGPSLAYRLKRSEVAGRVPIVAVARDLSQARAALARYEALEVDSLLPHDCDPDAFAAVVDIVAAYWYVAQSN